jgi:hypothetical protein
MKRMLFLLLWVPILALFTSTSSCEKDEPIPQFKTQNLIIVVVDGPRWSETWGDPQRQYIPYRANTLAKEGAWCANMRNEGATATNPGHSAITTGVYESINNSGLQFPYNPSFIQHWLMKTGKPSEKAWIITSKDKLHVLSDCINSDWQGKYKPSIDCGVAGFGTGYRDDSITYKRAIEIFKQHHPQVAVINFKEPDASGHAADWNAYINGIIQTDQYCKGIWELLQKDDFYKGTTTMFITNDHGRHPNGLADGFVSHGDGCEGCRHIEFIAVGPDVVKGMISYKQRSMVDIAATAATLLGLKMEGIDGKPMLDMFTQR